MPGKTGQRSEGGLRLPARFLALLSPLPSPWLLAWAALVALAALAVSGSPARALVRVVVGMLIGMLVEALPSATLP